MMSMQHRLIGLIALLTAASFFVVACSDDSGGNCDSDEEFNEVSGECEAIEENRDDSNRSGDDEDNNTPPGDDSDAGDNNSGDNNSGDNNSGDNNSGDNNDNPDAGDGDEDGGDEDGGDDDDEYDVGGCGPGKVTGTACDTSGARLSGAEVTIEGEGCEGEEFTLNAQSDSDGNFEFSEVPAGTHELTVTSGSFSDTQTIVVRDGEHLELDSSSKVCVDGGDVDIAVIEGVYDDVGQILDNLDLDYDVRGDDGGDYAFEPPQETQDFLGDVDEMKQYDIIFLNCGNLWNAYQSGAPTEVDAVIDNLEEFVDDGGSLYASDWAHPFIDQSMSSAIDFYGDSSEPTDAWIGYAPQTIPASVESEEMQDLLGGEDASIDFPHDPANEVYNTNWAVAEDIGGGSTTHIAGDAVLCGAQDDCSTEGETVDDSPLLVSHETSGGGTAIFTAFHNKSQGDVLNEDMEAILNFLIFQL